MTQKIDRRTFIGVTGAGIAGAATFAAARPAFGQQAALTRPIRLGFVGIGGRGSYHLDLALGIEGVEIPAICDIKPAALYQAKRWIEESGKPTPRLYGKTPTDFERLCAEEELDAVICCTSWEWHTPVSLAAMRNDKNCVNEVPAVQTIEEAWEVVETHEKTGKWATMGFKSPNSAITNMIYHGLLGDIVHCEGGYVHDLRNVKFNPDEEPWRLQHSIDRNGNLYPDHPTCRMIPVMDVNHGDRFDYLVSMSSNAVMLNRYAEMMYGEKHPYAKAQMKQGDSNTTLIRTVNGKMYTLNFDTNTPHPREITRIQGTKGVLMAGSGIGMKIYLDGISPEAHQWEDAGKYLEEYKHPLEKEYVSGPRRAVRGHGGGESATPLFWHRLILALREGRVSDFDVYDSVTSSVISPLSEMSVADNSKAIEFPDFTRGKWKERLPVEVAFNNSRKS